MWYVSDADGREVAQIWDWPNAEALANLYASAPALAAENAALREALADLLDRYDAQHGKLISGDTAFAGAYFHARAILAGKGAA
jgi:hypothetical protein